MQIYINEVEIGAEYDGKVYDYWIEGILKNGQRIIIFDNKPFDLRNKKNHYVECLIECTFVTFSNEKFEKDTIYGSLVEDVKLPSLYGVDDTDLMMEWFGIDTENGIFIISSSEISEVGYQSPTALKVGRFNLIGYNQNEY